MEKGKYKEIKRKKKELNEFENSAAARSLRALDGVMSRRGPL